MRFQRPVVVSTIVCSDSAVEQLQPLLLVKFVVMLRWS